MPSECSRHPRNPWRSSFLAERRGGRGTVFSTTSPCPFSFVAERGVYGFIIRARFHTLAKVSAPRPDDSVCRECLGAYAYIHARRSKNRDGSDAQNIPPRLASCLERGQAHKKKEREKKKKEYPSSENKSNLRSPRDRWVSLNAG